MKNHIVVIVVEHNCGGQKRQLTVIVVVNDRWCRWWNIVVVTISKVGDEGIGGGQRW